MKVFEKVFEGGCGVVGFCSTEKLSGKHLLPPCKQMHNRGNGKGGGIVALGLDNTQLGVPEKVLKNHYLIQIAFLDPSIKKELEKKYIFAQFDVHKVFEIERDNSIEASFDVTPPLVYRYFCKVKKDKLTKFMDENEFSNKNRAEDEYVFQNSKQLNAEFYAGEIGQKAFILCHGKDMIIFKIVGYAEEAIEYYKLKDIKANIWVGHQRYPTRGRVWHPGGAHPFIGLNEALVHNGDFANYHSICEYLSQYGRIPQFSTDTEVAVLLFDLWRRTFEYPLEYVIEALAPTTERDFTMLDPKKQEIYKIIQSNHIQNSPDGPWFFIIARNNTSEDEKKLIGITDTSMLRPQVFALQENEDIGIGIIASEKQAIDSILLSISSENKRFCRYADKYWNARGGSYTDGGSFIFSLKNNSLVCTDKFGEVIASHKKDFFIESNPKLFPFIDDLDILLPEIEKMDYNEFLGLLDSAEFYVNKQEENLQRVIEILTFLIDRNYPIGYKKRSKILELLHKKLYSIFRNIPQTFDKFQYINYKKKEIPARTSVEQTLIIDAKDFPPEGNDSLAERLVKAFKEGWKIFIIFDARGQRFCGCGFGLHSDPIYIDVYGAPGDYTGSGISNVVLNVHTSGQDQWGQIMKSGKLVIHGGVGQAFLYGAKGGNCYVKGNTAGRALINAVGNPRVVINGSCLDYLAESFMAGDPHKNGGFVILNGIGITEEGTLFEYEEPYPGGNLFSLPSGGAIFVRDPYQKTEKNQLNGSSFEQFTEKDWNLIRPYLEENERLFGIKVKDLLKVQGEIKLPEEVYRKISVSHSKVLK